MDRKFRRAAVITAALTGVAGSVSLPTASAADVQPTPVIVGLSADGPNGLNVRWQPGGPMSPGAYYRVETGSPNEVSWLSPTGVYGTSHTFDIGTGPGVARIRAQTGLNDPSPYVYANLYRTKLTSSIPAGTVYGQQTVITGTVRNLFRQCAISSCWPQEQHDYNRLVLLQARQGSGAWATVTSTRSSATGSDSYRFSVAAPGTRQYRVAVPSEAILGNGTDATVRTGVVGPAVTTATWFRVLGAKFLTATVTAGQKATAYTKVLPPVDGRVMLQRRTSTGWASVTWVPLNDGVAAYSFISRTRGSAGYRFYLPAASYAGRSIAATATSTFVLTTR